MDAVHRINVIFNKCFIVLFHVYKVHNVVFCFPWKQTHKTALLLVWALGINLSLTVYSNHFQHRLFWQICASLFAERNGNFMLSKGLVYCKAQIALDSRVVKLSRIKVQVKESRNSAQVTKQHHGLWTFQYTALVSAHSVNKSLTFPVSLP
jgi:hypothetical protein